MASVEKKHHNVGEDGRITLNSIWLYGRSLQHYVTFVALAHKAGLRVVGCDPTYSMPTPQLFQKIRDDIVQSSNALAKLSPNSTNAASEALRNRMSVFDDFSVDYERGKAEGRYLAASLPMLPFKDNTFDLVLHSFLLFYYAPKSLGGHSSLPTFDEAFHIASIREMLRVVKPGGQVLIYPTYGSGGKRHPLLDTVIAACKLSHVRADIVPSSRQSAYNKEGVDNMFLRLTKPTTVSFAL